MAKIIRKDLEAKLAALNGAEWDSMSDDSMGDEVTQDDVDMVIADDDEGSDHQDDPSIPLRLEAKEMGKRRKKKIVPSVVPIGPAGQPSGVVYIGHIPHGFYEEAMHGFFSQFGDVVRVRISRSKKSTRCKGYAYVEFTSPEVAGIVAETMDGYYLFEKQLVCRVLKFEEIHPNLFNGAGLKFKKINWHGLYRDRYNVDRTPAKDKKYVKKLLAKDNAKRKRLAALGIDYDFAGFAASLKDREVAEGLVQFIEPNSKEKGSDSKKRKSEETVTPAEKEEPSGERKEPPSVTNKAKAIKDSSKKSKLNTPSKAKEGTSKKSPPSKLKTASDISEGSAAAEKRTTDNLKVVQTPTSSRQTNGEVGEAAAGGSDKKKKKAKTPPKVKEESGGAAKTSTSSEGKALGRKGSASKGSSMKRKASKSPAPIAGGASRSTAEGDIDAPSSGEKIVKSPKSTKQVARKGSTEASQATRSTIQNRAKRNKPSKL